MKYAICGAELFDGTKLLQQHSVVVDGHCIDSIVPDHSKYLAKLPCIALDGGVIAPGFIDLQVNGGGGLLFNNAPSSTTIQHIITAHLSKGVTALLPTLISDQRDVLQAGIDATRHLLEQQQPGLIGLHIEGPFFNPQRRGVHNQDCIRPLTDDDVSWLCSNADIPLMVTLAPEQTRGGQIAALSAAGIIVCAGHSDADCEQISRALQEGLQGFTHLFNAMRPMTGREPGVVGTALADQDSYCGIIVDGHHVHPTSVLAAYQAKQDGKLFLVSDAMATIGSNKKSFELYGESIIEQDGKLLNSEGKLAGSAIGMIDAVRISQQQVGLPLEACLAMASLYPATLMQQHTQRGRLAAGFHADLVHFDKNFNVSHTWQAGELLFENEVYS